jgi:hypothetical protein
MSFSRAPPSSPKTVQHFENAQIFKFKKNNPLRKGRAKHESSLGLFVKFQTAKSSAQEPHRHGGAKSYCCRLYQHCQFWHVHSGRQGPTRRPLADVRLQGGACGRRQLGVRGRRDASPSDRRKFFHAVTANQPDRLRFCVGRSLFDEKKI